MNRIYAAIMTALLVLMAVSAMAGTAAAENQPPVAVMETLATYGETPYDMYVNGEYYSYDPDGTIVSYDWDFGDGGTYTEANVWHTYNDSGDYTISLTVTDNEGATGCAYVDVLMVPGDNPISDNGMKAYVWNALEHELWNTSANAFAANLEVHGFEVIRHMEPDPTVIYQTISDPDVKVYLGVGHGADTGAYTGVGTYHATIFGSVIESRGYPLTIGIFNHCGNYSCYTPGRWLQESTQGDDNVVAQRFYGEGWCGDSGTGGTISAMSFNVYSLMGQLSVGYTYSDAVDMVQWTGEEGKKQGNQDLRYPQFCGDVNYDMVVDPADATLLNNHITDPNTYPIHSEWDADVNGDGSVNIDDADLLELHVNNPAANPLYPRGWGIDTCPCDLNRDGFVNNDDVLEIVANWGPCSGCRCDLNNDGYVNYDDVLMICANWGPCPE